jgi:hypothetical protein
MNDTINKNFAVIYTASHGDTFGYTNSLTVWGYGEDMTECKQELQKELETWQGHFAKYTDPDCQKMAQKYIDQKERELKTVRVMKVEDYQKELDATMLQGAREITEELYWDMLGCLPPLQMGQNFFIMSEFLTGSFTRQFFKKNGKFYEQIIDYRRQETWAVL